MQPESIRWQQQLDPTKVRRRLHAALHPWTFCSGGGCAGLMWKGFIFVDSWHKPIKPQAKLGLDVINVTINVTSGTILRHLRHLRPNQDFEHDEDQRGSKLAPWWQPVVAKNQLLAFDRTPIVQRR